MPVEILQAELVGAASEVTQAALLAETQAARTADAARRVPADPETGLAKDATLMDLLAAVRQQVATGTVALDAATLAALEQITAVVSGTVTVSNPTPAPETGLAKDATLAAVLAATGSTADSPSVQTVVGLLKQIGANTAAIKLDADHLNIDADRIDLSVDGLEALVGTTNAGIGAPGDPPSANTVIGRLKAILAGLPASPETGLAKDATLTSGAQKAQVTNFPAVQQVTGPVTDAQIRAVPVPVSGPLTDAALRASAVPVTVSNPTTGFPDVSDRAARLLGHATVDNFPAVQSVSGTVSVSNPTTGTPDVSDRAARLLGHVTVDNFPATQQVAGTVTVSNPTTAPETGLAKDATLTGGAAKTQVTNFPATQPVSAAGLPLPAGAARDATLTDGSQRASVTLLNPTANPETGLAKDVTLAALAASFAPALRDGGARVREVDHIDRQQFDYYTPAGSSRQQIRYLGTAPQGTANTASAWTVQRLTWAYDAGGDRIVDLQTLTGVPWGATTASRDALTWST